MEYMYFVSFLEHGPGQGEFETYVFEHDLEHHRQWHGQHHLDKAPARECD
ncbi:MAG: hypothetical protein P4L85_23520 [Paludisphaera borealis]|nr:hypothetical protein [Paludisphaera borealis]MDR3622340.1 hypothetical protein [Paludisphaera borealis]